MDINEGLDLEHSFIDKEVGSWNDAQNIILNKDLKSSRNEEGCEVILNSHTRRIIIGVANLDEATVYFSIDNKYTIVPTPCEIGIYRNGGYTTVLRSMSLLFNTYNPIDAVLTRNPANELIVIWCDGVADDSNIIRYLNIDNPGFEINLLNYDFVNPDDLNKLNLFNNVNIPILDNYYITSTGGSCKTGSYWFFISYQIDSYNSTPYSISSQPIHLGELNTYYVSTGSPFYSFTGCAQAITTTKAIQLTLSNLDTRYGSFNLGVVKEINGVKTAHLVKTVIFNNSSENVTFDGTTIQDLSLSDLLVPNANFAKCKSLTINDNMLVASNIRNNNFDYQTWASQINVTFQLEDINAPSGASWGNQSNNSNSIKLTFIPNEVYALYAHLVWLDGSISDGFHIPGRVARAGETDVLNPAAFTELVLIEAAGGAAGTLKRFHVEDTSSLAGGVLGYWENANEVYPVTFDTIGGQNVRHHRMPSVVTFPILDNYALVDYRKPNTITLSFNNVFIPDEIKDKVQGVCFSYAKRNFTNSLIIGEGQGYIRTATDTLEFSDTGLLAKKPTLYGTYLKYVSNVYNITNGAIVGVYGISRYTAVANNAVSHISTYNYLPANNTSVSPATQGEVLRITTTNTITKLVSYVAGADYITAQIVRHSLDVYQNFYEQELVLSNCIIPTTSIQFAAVSGGLLLGSSILERPCYGDSYISRHLSKVFYLPTASYFIAFAYSPVNGCFTIEDTAGAGVDILTHFSSYDVVRVADAASTINDIKSPLVRNHNLTQLNLFPKHIYRSIQQQKESLTFAWRTFLANDYYVLTANSSDILFCDSDGDNLFIQCEERLFIASIKDVLKTDSVTAYLGTGDIFDRPPIEILKDKVGKIGCKSRYAHTICELGYIVVDRVKGKIFIVNKETGVAEISSVRTETFFKDNLNTTGWSVAYNEYYDNPFIGIGISLAYDRDNDRIIISKRDYLKPTGTTINPTDPAATVDVPRKDLTISFNVKKKRWISKHSYHPNFIFSTQDGLFSIVNYNIQDNEKTQVFKHNATNKCIYFDCSASRPVPAKSYIDLVFNQYPEVDKILISSKWIVDSYLDNIIRDDITISEIMAYTDKQCTGILQVNALSDWYDKQSGRNLNGEWFFNDFRDGVIDDNLAFLDDDNLPINTNVNKNLKSFFEIDQIISKFVVLRLSVNNYLISGKQIYYKFLKASIDIQKYYR